MFTELRSFFILFGHAWLYLHKTAVISETSSLLRRIPLIVTHAHQSLNAASVSHDIEHQLAVLTYRSLMKTTADMIRSKP